MDLVEFIKLAGLILGILSPVIGWLWHTVNNLNIKTAELTVQLNAVNSKVDSNKSDIKSEFESIHKKLDSIMQNCMARNQCGK